MSFALTVADPTEEPVDLELAKSHLKVDYADEDQLIQFWITAARQQVEEFTQKVFGQRTAVALWDRFPPYDSPQWNYWVAPGYIPGPDPMYPNTLLRAIRLPIWPVLSVQAVKYRDTAIGGGTVQTLVDGTDYLTHLSHMPALIYPFPGKYWPITQFARLGNVEVDFTAGYAATKIPPQVGQAVLLILGYWWKHRGDGVDPTTQEYEGVKAGIPAGAIRLLNSMSRGLYG